MSGADRMRLPLSRRTVFLGLAAAVACQVALLVGMQLKAALPHWTGTTVRIATNPIDPRSLFRGNYATLRYDTVNALKTLPHQVRLRHGEVVYLQLTPTEQGLHRWTAASLTPPKTGLFVRARIQRFGRAARATRAGIAISIPQIEAYFAPKAEALRLEQDLRDGGVAVVRVSAGGQAALSAVEAMPEG